MDYMFTFANRMIDRFDGIKHDGINNVTDTIEYHRHGILAYESPWSEDIYNKDDLIAFIQAYVKKCAPNAYISIEDKSFKDHMSGYASRSIEIKLY